MRARRKQKRVFQHQTRTTIPPESVPDEVYDDYKYDCNRFVTNTNEDISTTPRGGIRSQYI